MTKSTALENFHGPMAASTKVSGSKESSMAWACIQLAKARKGTGSGETASCTKLLKNKTNKIKHKKNYERENYKIVLPLYFILIGLYRNAEYNFHAKASKLLAQTVIFIYVL